MKITLPFTKEICDSLHAGDSLQLSGTIYTARDAAHVRLSDMIQKGKPLPFDLKDACIYYVGPTPAPLGSVVGSAGPTTSMRMDAYAPLLYDLGVKATMGKGYRTQAVFDAIQRNHGCYLICIGGGGALLSQCIKKARCIAFEDLGAEAIYEYEIEDFPCIVAIDSKGNSLYETYTCARNPK